ncbi:50S ribosomal protein L6, partial [Planctomycetota bacterium]
MSRLGKIPVAIPSGAKINISQREINIEGPLGKLNWQHPEGITVEMADNMVSFQRADNSRQQRAYHGLTRALVNNMLIGVTQGFRKELRIVGVGWNAKAQGKGLSLTVGYSHPVEMEPPEGVKVEIPQAQIIHVSGPDKQKVGQFAANIRRVRPPEPYNQKGIRYADEEVRKKA